MNRKPIERKGTPFPKSAPRMPAVPLPKSASRPSVARGQTTGAIKHSLPLALQIRIPGGATPPKQQVFQRPSLSISSVPERKATPYPIRQDSKPMAPWNAARPPTPSPHAPSRLRGRQPLRINSSLANSFQSTPQFGESIPPTRRKNDEQSSVTTLHSSRRNLSVDSRPTILKATTVKVNQAPKAIEVRVNKSTGSATDIPFQKYKEGDHDRHAGLGLGLGMNSGNTSGKRNQTQLHSSQSTMQAPSGDQKPQLKSEAGIAGASTALNTARIQNQPQPVSNAKKSFKSIFKKKETKSKGSHTAGIMQHFSPRSPMAVRPAKTKTKNEEEREGAKDKKSKSSTGYSKGASKQHDNLEDHGASRQHTTVNKIYSYSSEKGTSSHIDRTYQPEATQHIHHATEVHHRTSPLPAYTASPLPPAYNFEDTADYKRRLRFHDTDESFHSERLCPLFDPETRQPLTLKEFRELPRVPIQKFNSLMNLVEYPKRCSRAELERLIPSNISRFLFVTADARDTASIEYVRERKAFKLWARGWRVVVRVGGTETVTGWCNEF